MKNAIAYRVDLIGAPVNVRMYQQPTSYQITIDGGLVVWGPTTIGMHAVYETLARNAEMPISIMRERVNVTGVIDPENVHWDASVLHVYAINDELRVIDLTVQEEKKPKKIRNYKRRVIV